MPEKNKIVIVDDEPQALASFLLTSLGKDFDYRFFCDNPLEAIDYCASHNVEAAFLDIRMPNINGIDLAKEILKVNATIKIIFITAFTYDEEAVKQELGERVLGFAYKPFDPTKLNAFFAQIEQRAQNVMLRTFGPFDVFVDDEAVNFSSAKSKELLALLLVYDGSTVSLEQTITRLWPSHDEALSKRLYRDAKIRLRTALEEAGILDLVTFGYGFMRINKSYAKSDYWDFMSGKTKGYKGQFLIGYPWAKEFQYPMDLKLAGMR